MLTWMGATFIVGGIAVVTAICGGRYHGKYRALKKQYDKLTQDLTNALGEVGRSKLLIESMQESNADMVERISEYKHLMTSGCRNLKTHEWSVSVASQELITGISVIGQDTINPDLWFGVKEFLFNFNDPEDREFAIREAEELIETIQNF